MRFSLDPPDDDPYGDDYLTARCACGQAFLVRVDDDDRTQCEACEKHEELQRRLARRAEQREQEKAS